MTVRTALLGSTWLIVACGGPGLAHDGDPAPATMQVAADSTYGRSEANPIMVGGLRNDRGPANEKAYLGSLRGPNGEPTTFRRQGSCCAFRTPNGPIENIGMLDAYEVTYAGLAEPIVLYINMYDYSKPAIPVGFTQAAP